MTFVVSASRSASTARPASDRRLAFDVTGLRECQTPPALQKTPGPGWAAKGPHGQRTALSLRRDGNPSRSCKPAPVCGPQEAWVGWLVCQTVLLVLVESTPLALLPWWANLARLALCAAFLGTFCNRCFTSPLQKFTFICSTLGAEGLVAVASDRLPDVHLLAALAVCGLGMRLLSRGGRLWVLNAGYPVLAWGARTTFRWLGLAPHNGARLGLRLARLLFGVLERSRRACALGINRERCLLL